MSKKIPLALISVVLFLIVLLLAIPSFIDWNQYKERVISEVKNATGYNLALKGDFSGALFPVPRVTMHDISVDSGDNHKGGIGFDVTAKQVSVSVALFPLLTGQIAIGDIRLVNPVVKLVEKPIPRVLGLAPDEKAKSEEQGFSDEGDSSLSIDSLSLVDAKISYTSLNEDSYSVGFPRLHLNMDSLFGPYDFNGDVDYNNLRLTLEGDMGAYAEKKPIQANVTVFERSGAYQFGFDGVVQMGDKPDVQGQVTLKTSALKKMLNTFEQDISMPFSSSPVSLSGLLSYKGDSVLLDQGQLSLDNATADLRFDVTDLNDNYSRKMALKAVFKDSVDLDEILKTVESYEKTSSSPDDKDDDNISKAKEKSARFMPESLELPSAGTMELSLKIPEITYQDKAIETFDLNVKQSSKKLSGVLNVGQFPGQGNAKLKFDLVGESLSKNSASNSVVFANPSLEIVGDVNVKVLKDVVGDHWLNLADDQLLETKGMPQSLMSKIDAVVMGHQIKTQLSELTLDSQPPLFVNFGYNVKNQKPVLTVGLKGDKVTVPEGLLPEDDDKKSIINQSDDNRKSTPGDKGKAAHSTAIGFDVALQSLLIGDKTLKGFFAKGKWDNNGVDLKTFKINDFEGTALSVVGRVKDVSTLNGTDIKAQINSQAIDPLLKTFAVSMPDSLPQPVGAVNASVIAKGDSEALNVDLTGSVYGFTIKTAGQVSDPMGTVVLPKSFKITASHPNAGKAVQVFQPSYQPAKSLQKKMTFETTVTGDEDKTALKDIRLEIGDMAASGAAIIETDGEKPSVKANLNFSVLDTQALLGGKSSEGQKTETRTAGKKETDTSSKQKNGSPWTRDAIDTQWMRSIDFDLDAKARKLIHGPWEILRPAITMTLSNGVLELKDLSGTLFDGSVKMNGKATATAKGQPLKINAGIDMKDVNLAPLVKAASGQTKDRVIGKGDFSLKLATNGISSSALMFGLNGDGVVSTSNLVVNGIDLDRISQTLAGDNLAGLGGLIDDALNSGSTSFKPLEHAFQIREGTMPVENLRLESKSSEIISNGMVSFSRWMMDLKNEINVTQPEALPVISLGLKGPLNAPQKNIESDIVRNFIMNKYGSKIQKKITDIVGDTGGAAGQLLNNILGVPQNDNVSPEEKEPGSETEPAQQKQSPEKQLIEGLFNRLSR